MLRAKLIVFLVLIASGTSYEIKSSANIPVSSDIKTNMDESTNKNPYFELRGIALSATAEQLRLDLAGDRLQTFGVVIDIAEDGGSATIAAFRTGDASLYTSQGGGMIGGAAHANVRSAAVELANKAEASIATLTKTSEAPLPPAGRVRIYVLTNQGKYFGEEDSGSFFSENSKYLTISQAANELMTQLRMVDEGQQNSER